MKWNVCFCFKKIRTEPKQKELELPISELNGTFTFIPVKIGTKPKLKEFLISILEQNGTFAFILAKIETNQSKQNLYYQFRNEMERLLLFQ
jgi:hypothetical protein